MEQGIIKEKVEISLKYPVPMSILHQVPSQAKIERELRKILFGKKVFCPRCGSRMIKKYEGRYRCKRCRRPFTLKSVCWLKGAKLPLTTIWLLMWCWSQKVPVDQTRKVCGLSEPTVRRWFERFRINLPQEKFFNLRLSGKVQMDEFYRGSKKKGYAIIGAKEEKGSKDKKSSNKRRKVALKALSKPSVDRKDVIDFLSCYVEPETQLQTDGYSVYKGIESWWPVKHLFEIHKRWEFSLTSEIEGLWGNFITFIRRMYHHVTREKLALFLKEFTARQVYPEWFQSPYSLVEVLFQPLPRISRKPGRPKKKIFSISMPSFSFQGLTKQDIPVPY